MMKIIYLILAVFFSNIVFAASAYCSHSNNPGDGVVTAHAYFDGGHAEYDGYSNGKIYVWNAQTCKQIKNLPDSGNSIDAIANTANNGYLGDFTFIQNGQVYTYYNNKTSCINLQFPGEAKFLTYNINSGLCCSTPSGFVYLLYRTKDKNNNIHWNWQKISDKNFEGQTITVLQYLSSGLYIAVNTSNVKGTLYRYSYYNKKWNLLKTLNSKINSVIQNKNDSEKINVLLSDSSVYSINIQNGTTINISFMFNNTIDKNSAVTWHSNRSLKETSASTRNSMKVYVNYVSSAYNRPDEAIYRVTIHGRGLDQDELFKKGYNGIQYKLTCNGKTTYAYPILGYRYTEDNYADKAALNPRDISFLWIGPKCQNNKKLNLQVEEIAHYFTKTARNSELSNPKGLHTSVAEINPDSWQPPAGLKIEITPSAFNDQPACPLIANGTCTMPFEVVIKKRQPDGSLAPIPAGSDIYNHLSFYINDGDSGNIKPDEVIGANPFHSGTNCISILSADSVDIGNHVNYGTYKTPENEGREYYLIKGTENSAANSSSTDSLTAALISENNNSITTDALTIGTPRMCSLKGNLSQESEYQDKITFGDNKNPSIPVSSWEGYNNGKGVNTNSGYLDYISPDSNKMPGFNNGIYAVFPQGENSLTMEQRLNPANMQVGYYFNPFCNDVNDGLHADEYRICNPTYAAYCELFRNSLAYYYAFDRFGRYYQGTTQVSSGNGHWKKDFMKVKLTNWSNVPICMHSDLAHLGGVPKYGKGIFLPPSIKHDKDHSGTVFVTLRHWASSVKVDATVYGDKICDYLGKHEFDDSFDDPGDYFKSHLGYYSPSGCNMHAWVTTCIDNLKAGESLSEDYKFLPVNQLRMERNDTSEPGYKDGSLHCWGIHFVPKDIAYSLSKHRTTGAYCHGLRTYAETGDFSTKLRDIVNYKHQFSGNILSGKDTERYFSALAYNGYKK